MLARALTPSLRGALPSGRFLFSDLTILILAGTLCFGNRCVQLEHPVLAHLIENRSALTAPCMQEVEGCAIVQKNEVFVHSKGSAWTYATLFHELLHIEYWQKHRDLGHSREMIERDNELRDDLGVHDRYLYVER